MNKDEIKQIKEHITNIRLRLCDLPTCSSSLKDYNDIELRLNKIEDMLK